MSRVTTNQPTGTPTWVELRVPDPEPATRFYRALFGWTVECVGDTTMCLLDGLPVAAVSADRDVGTAPAGWDMYLAADDCDEVARRVTTPVAR